MISQQGHANEFCPIARWNQIPRVNGAVAIAHIAEQEKIIEFINFLEAPTGGRNLIAKERSR